MEFPATMSGGMEIARKMVEKALEHESMPPEYQLRNMWGESVIDPQELKGDLPHVEGIYDVRLSVRGSSTNVEARCYVKYRYTAGSRSIHAFGTCHITLVDTVPQRTFEFECEVEDNRMVVTPVPEPGY
jgi:hypothetical protein